MVCSLCGDGNHNLRTCPLTRDSEQAKEESTDVSRRGQRDSPRTPNDDQDKLAKLRSISEKLSPSVPVPALPRLDSAGLGSASDKPGGHPEIPQTADETLDRIMEMMNNVVVKDDLEAMKTSLLKEVDDKTKVSIATAVDPLRSELHDLKSRVGIMEAAGPSAMGEDANEMKLNVISKGEGAEMIEHAIEKRLVTGTTKNRHSGSSDVLFGGMEASIQQEAEEWIIRKLKELKLEEPADIYFKGNEFTGILYAKFSSPDAAEKLTRAFENGQYTISGKKVWCKKDLPIDIRAPMSFYSGSGGS